MLVADVARRRPLLTRDVLSPDLGLTAAYVQTGCASRLPAASSADVVMASADLVLDQPDFTGAFTHVVLLDPPFTTAMWTGLVAAAPDAWFHALWGPAEVEFAGRVRDGQLALDQVMRTVWKALAAGSGRFDEALEQELLGQGPCSRRWRRSRPRSRRFASPASSWSTRPAGSYLERPQSKVDVTRTDAYRGWQTRFLTPDFLQACLTARL